MFLKWNDGYIGEKWVIFVLNSIGSHGAVRFVEIQKELKGVSPSRLSWILKKLSTRNIVKREVFSEIPPRVEYSLPTTGT